MTSISKFNRSTEKVLGVSIGFLLIDLLARGLMLAFFFGLGTYLHHMTQIPPELAYKYSYPALDPADQTVPVSKLGQLIVVMALTGFILNHIFLHMIGYPCKIISADAYHFLMATTMAAFSTMALVQSLKLWVARPRPDFLSRCFPDGYDLAHWNRLPECTRPLHHHIVNDGLQSFPSGHSAAAWSASVFCFLYLREHYKAHSHHIPSRVPRCVPFLFAFALAIFASYVSCSRLWDFQHHPEDVIAGGLIGCGLTYLSFFLYYPISPNKIQFKRKNGSPSSDCESQSLLSGAGTPV